MNPAIPGENKTGIQHHPALAEAMQAGMDRFPPTSSGTLSGPAMVRVQYAKEGASIGSPPTGGIKEKVKNFVDELKGGEPVALLDKLGERLAFERLGTRLYEALVSKHEAFGGFPGGPSRDDLLDILEDERTHFMMLTEMIQDAGHDPTAMTPSADIAATAASGVLKVVTDPRTDFLQSLDAVLIAELTDNDGWELLIELVSDESGKDTWVQPFKAALIAEREHLEKIRRWIRAGRGHVEFTA